MNKPLLDIKNLSISITTADNLAFPVTDIDLKMYPGRTVALVGESGSGKSILARSIMGLLPQVARISAGSIDFAGQNIEKIGDEQFRFLRGSELGIIFQEPMSSLNALHTVEQQVGEVLRVHQKMDRQKVRDRVLSMLELVGIDNPDKRLSSRPHELSGGQRQRVAIAMALINNPKLLIADEPTTALDVAMQQQVLDLLASLQKRLNTAILLISHDLKMVGDVADIVYVMHSGKIVEHGPIRKVLESPRHEYTRLLLGAGQRSRPAPLPEKSCDPPLLDLAGVNVRFGLQKNIFGREKSWLKAVQNVSFSLGRGECLGLVGESGCGKSTLARAILGLLPWEGQIKFRGQNIRKMKGRRLRKARCDLQTVFQDPFASLNPRMIVADIITEGPRAHFSISREEKNVLAMTALEEVGLDPGMCSRYPNEFSGGQRQRIAIARAIVMKPDLIILDEPTSSLDRSLQFQTIALLKKLQLKHEMAYLFITHDLELVKIFCHNVVVMKSGKIVEAGSVSDVFSTPQDPYTSRI